MSCKTFFTSNRGFRKIFTLGIGLGPIHTHSLGGVDGDLVELLWAVVAQPHPRPAPAANANLPCTDRGGAQSGSRLIYGLENKMYALRCQPPPLSTMRIERHRLDLLRQKPGLQGAGGRQGVSTRDAVTGTSTSYSGGSGLPARSGLAHKNTGRGTDEPAAMRCVYFFFV